MNNNSELEKIATLEEKIRRQQWLIRGCIVINLLQAILITRIFTELDWIIKVLYQISENLLRVIRVIQAL